MTEVVRAAAGMTGATWMDDAAAVTEALGIAVPQSDQPPWKLVDRSSPRQRREAVQSWKRTVLKPAVLEYGGAWVLQQSATETALDFYSMRYP